MFNNPFLKKDPLVEAVRQAQHDGDMRRQAIAIVNEQFGVYSRNAVVREDLAAYDAAIEEAYKCMKEGKPLADKDYDKDGKVESPKDEVWGSRFRAAKMAGKMEEGLDVVKRDPSVQGSGDVTKSAPKEDPSTPKSYPGAASTVSGPNPTSQRMSNAKAAVQEAKGTAAVQNLKHRDFKETRHPNKNAVTKAPVPGVSIAEDQLDELSRKTLGSYIKKAADDSSYNSFVAGAELGNRGNSNLRLASDRKAMKRLAGVNKAADKLAKEEWEGSKEDKSEDKALAKKHGMTMKQWEKSDADKKHDAKERIDEVSRGLLKRYIAKADKRKKYLDDKKRVGGLNKDPKKGITPAEEHKRIRHYKGVNLAHAKISGPRVSATNEEVEQMDEAAYSAKAARAGKDIGKPGKQFAKIAKKAGERYGSEERGKKVAGAILKRIRAKHMKEDFSND